jgi:hypothetical protein
VVDVRRLGEFPLHGVLPPRDASLTIAAPALRLAGHLTGSGLAAFTARLA